MDKRQLTEAAKYNARRAFTGAEVEKIQETVGVRADGIIGALTLTAIAQWQHAHALDPDGKLGPSSWRRMVRGWHETRALTPEEYDALIMPTVLEESGRAGEALNLDFEYELFRGRYHKEGEDPTHIGVSMFAWHASQDSGNLGLIFKQWHRDNPETFLEVYGEHALAMLEVTNRRGPRAHRLEGDPGKRRPSVMPVAGEDLWKGHWVARHRDAVRHPHGKAAARAVIVREFLEPMIRFGFDVGLTTQADLAVLFDISIQMGPGFVTGELWSLVCKSSRPPRIEDFLEHLSPRHRSRRLDVLERVAWWITYTREGET